ncbi:hypothetical protein GWN63_04650, partial [Candidatus Bathyarchaeota archaeon]|nr:hypothetical protein [Candidatus Bathyarchaeota archaeon]NIR16414.1 hypothetical protein [Desulfobacterales bacterium]NIU81515.1 hypothetical protein [Candidatus Bathyarchaeota archaeon]NIV68161.1 hypothetical protein [Candidatus Bathyarchaeota archaeon]NIW16536.1 hypothetical protein [Candidatus Bathyarchaeota archaeon]
MTEREGSKSIQQSIPEDQEWHTLETEDLLDALEISKEGLSEEKADRRLQEFGPNELVEKERVTP